MNPNREPRLLLVTARQLREFALPAQLTGVGVVPLGLGTVPVASWYGAIFASPGERNKCILYN
jgi:hypothetical protein